MKKVLIVLLAIAVIGGGVVFALTRDKLTITQQPVDFTGRIGETAEFTVTAEGKDLSYQWQTRDGDEEWQDASANAATYTLGITEDRNGREFRCIVTNGKGKSMTSDAAKLIIELYTITYDAAPGSFTDGATYAAKAEPGTCRLGTPEDPVCEGRAFYGWAATPDASDEDVVTRIEVTADTTVYAIYEETFTVTYDANGGAFDGETEKYEALAAPGLYKIGADVPEPTREGYKFIGWTDEDGRFLSETALNSDASFTAEWDDAVSVTYDANGGSFGEEAVDVVSIEIGTWYANDHKDPVWPGHEFLGWMLDGKYVNKLTVTEPVTLVADWQEAIEVTYDANGGYFGFNHQGEPITTEITYEQKGTYYVGWAEPQNEDGLTFDGWTVNGERLRIIELSEPITVMAQWR